MEWLEPLSHWPVASALRQWAPAYALVNATHILGIGLLVGAIATLDARLLGAFRGVPLPHLAGPLVRVAAMGLALAIGTGFLLFTVRPTAYAENPAFLLKISLVALGILNAVLLRLGGGWREAMANGTRSPRLKVGAFLSLAIWSCAVICGRWIGFSQ